MAALILVLLGVLMTAYWINKYIFTWHRDKVREIRRQEAELELKLRIKQKKQEKLNERFRELEKTLDTYENLADRRELGQIPADPGEWLLEEKAITLSQYLRAREQARQSDVDFVDACLELNFIDRSTARKARAFQDPEKAQEAEDADASASERSVPDRPPPKL